MPAARMPDYYRPALLLLLMLMLMLLMPLTEPQPLPGHQTKQPRL
jgi:hypothetical protein